MSSSRTLFEVAMQILKNKWFQFGVVVVVLLGWYFFPRTPMPLGYVGTAPHLQDVMGVRPTVEIKVEKHQLLKKMTLFVDNREVRDAAFTLPRVREVNI